MILFTLQMVNTEPVLSVTHILIPQQSGTADSCIADEDGILACQSYLLSNNLSVFGWIHVSTTMWSLMIDCITWALFIYLFYFIFKQLRPRCQAFMSTAALHQQLSRQAVSPDSVTVIVSPEHAE